MSTTQPLLDPTYQPIGTCVVCGDHIVTQDQYQLVASQTIGGGSHRQYVGQACFCQGCGIRYNPEVVARNRPSSVDIK